MHMNACPFIASTIIDKDEVKKWEKRVLVREIESVKIEVTINISRIFIEPSTTKKKGTTDKRKTLLKNMKSFPTQVRSLVVVVSNEMQARIKGTNRQWRWHKISSKARFYVVIRIEEITFVSFFCQTFSTQFPTIRSLIIFRWISCLWWMPVSIDIQALWKLDEMMKNVCKFVIYKSINFSRWL